MIIENSRVLYFSKKGYRIKEEQWKSSENDKPLTIRTAYSDDRIWIGDVHLAKLFTGKKFAIRKFEKIEETDCIASIGFSPSQNKWYGWSHRAIFGFGIGSHVKKGDVAYTPATPQELYDEVTRLNEEGRRWVELENVEMLEHGITIIIPCSTYVCDDPNQEFESTSVTPGKWVEAEPYYETIECGKGEWTALTIEDAKQMAMDFSRGVS